MTEFGRTDYITVQEFEKLGYRLVIFPVTAFRVMMKSVQDSLGELRSKGTQKGLLRKMMDRGELYDLIGYGAYETVDGQTARRARRLLDTNL
jgi:methylisocitrate lyase